MLCYAMLCYAMLCYAMHAVAQLVEVLCCKPHGCRFDAQWCHGMSNIKRYKEGASKHNTLLRCNVSQDRQHVSALYYKAITRSDK